MKTDAADVTIVSSALDFTTDSVVVELDGRGASVRRLNTEDFPFGEQLSWRPAATPQAPIQPCDWGNVWLRRLRTAPPPEAMSPGVYEFCRSESYHALLGMLLTIPDDQIMSPLRKIWAAENKLFQLHVASSMGLRVPRTLVSNRPADIISTFHTFSHGMICKPVRTGYVEDGAPSAIFTTEVLEEHLDMVESAALCPSIYQELVPKACDVRVTYVAGEFFIAEIESQLDPHARIDWRATHDPYIPHRRADLPVELEARIGELLQCLGLEFGAIDLIKTPQDEYVFVEVNPNGQWLWLEDALDFRISAAVADHLLRRGQRRGPPDSSGRSS